MISDVNLYTIINAIANCTTAMSAIGLLIHIFGDPDNPIWINKVQAWLAKAGLSILICGAVSNVLTLSTPAKTEVLLNCGMSITFFWLSLWQYNQFKEKVNNSKKYASTKKKKKPTVSKTKTVNLKKT
jgi:hypothetical protein